jgi:TPR repeat protein
MNLLAWMYVKGQGGLSKDTTEAKKLLLSSIDCGDRNALFLLGTMYEQGLLQVRDVREGEKWIRFSRNNL